MLTPERPFLLGVNFLSRRKAIMNCKTKRITAIGMLCAITYVTMVVGRIPIILFLKYDPSDVIVTLGGFIWGPMTSCIVSVIVATLEMITVSDTGILGCIMNIVQTLSFACTASIIYKKKHTLSGALIGLASGWLITVIVMLLWNYLVTPLYMGYPREAVVELLLPAFLPFNLLKGGLNASITFLLYKPIVTALRKSGYISTLEKDTRQQHTGLLILANFIIVTCVLIILSMNGII
jgi:riboflavin transporter FmnP